MNQPTNPTEAAAPVAITFSTKTMGLGPETVIQGCPDQTGACAVTYEFKFCLDVFGDVARHCLRVPEDDDVRERDKLIEIVYPKVKEYGGIPVYTKTVKAELALAPVVSWRAKRADPYTPLTAADFGLEVRGLAVDGVAEPDPAVPSIYTVDLTVLDGNQLGTPMSIVTFSVVAKALKKVEIGGATIKKGVSFVVDPVVIIAPKRP